MLLFNMVRDVDSEQTATEDTTGYSGTAPPVHDWTTRASKSITLPKAQLVWIKFTAQISSTSGSCRGAARVLNGTVPVMSTGDMANGLNNPCTREALVFLSAGSYTFNFQTSIYYISTQDGITHAVNITSIWIGALNFADLLTLTLDSGTVNADGGGATTVVIPNQTLNMAVHVTPIGNIHRVPVQLLLYVEGVGNRKSVVLNGAEATQDGRLNWRLYLNDSPVSFSYRRDDCEVNTINSNPTYAEGAYGGGILGAWLFNAGTDYTIRVDCINRLAGAQDVRATIAIVGCPWFLPSYNYEPVLLKGPHFSTVYITLEPLNTNPAKTIFIGKQRFRSFGDSTDYYYKPTPATDIMNCAYTFENVKLSALHLYLSGLGGCISCIGIDMR